MRLSLTMLATVTLAACGAGVILQSARAQVTHGQAIPQGSYLRSCSQVSYDPTFQTLKAMCVTAPPSSNAGETVATFLTGGLYRGPTEVSGQAWSQLNVAACQPNTDIENLNGRLQCLARTGTWGDGGAVPKGSYQQSCDLWNEQTVSTGKGTTYPRLAAHCKTFYNNGEVTALLDLSNCSMSGDIQNFRGTLLCAPAQNARAAPPATKPGACRPGFVPRLVNAEDNVCVTEAERQQVQYDNLSAPRHTAPRAVHTTTPPGCLEGYVWRHANATDFVCATVQSRSQAKTENEEAPARVY